MCTVLSRFQIDSPLTTLSAAIIVILGAIHIMSCPVWASTSSGSVSPIDLLAKELATQLSNNLNSPSKSAPRTLVVNLVDVNQLHCTSRFGQILPEKLRIQLQALGWKIVESRRGLKIIFQENVGQFNLSDRLKDLAKEVRCDAILTGTYLFHMGLLMVHMRLIRLSDNELISSAEIEMPAGPWIATLLKPVGFGCKAPRAFLKIAPWKDTVDEDSVFSDSMKEDFFDESEY